MQRKGGVASRLAQLNGTATEDVRIKTVFIEETRNPPKIFRILHQIKIDQKMHRPVMIRLIKIPPTAVAVITV